MNALRVALGIFSGRIILNFAILENLRIFQNCLFTRGVVTGNSICSTAGLRPLRRSRARFPFLSPMVTSSPGAGEVFPQRESQGLRLVAKVSGVKRKFPAVLLPLPLGEVSPQVMERAHAVSTVAKVSGAMRKLPAVLLAERAHPLPTQKAPLPCAESGAFFNLFLPGCGKPGAVLSSSYWWGP